MKLTSNKMVTLFTMITLISISFADIPNPADPNHTLFLCHYDGYTGNSGRDADYGAGGDGVQSTGGVISSTAKFGSGSLDTSGIPNIPWSGTHPPRPTNAVDYNSVGNYDPCRGTIEMWIKPNSWSSTDREFLFGMVWPVTSSDGPREQYNHCDIQMMKYPGLDWPGVGPSARLYCWQDGDLYDVDDRWWTNSWQEALDDGQWHHIAWTWDQTVDPDMEGQVYLYIDGVSVGTTAVPEWSGELAPKFWVGFGNGGQYYNGYYKFNGLIDEFRISNIDRYKGQNFTPHTMPWPTPGAGAYCGDASHPYPEGDLNSDCLIDVLDLEYLVSEWLTDNRP